MVQYFGSGYGLARIDGWLDDSIPHNGSGDRKFPNDWADAQSVERQGEDESNVNYFKRVAEDVFDGKPERGAIEESVLALISLSYDQGIITKLNVETFVALGSNATLEDAYYDECVDYLRMDYDAGHPGPLFIEPQPHIHTGRGAPRLGLDVSSDRSLLASFFDAVYRNYLPKQWRSWCREVWKEVTKPRNLEVGLFDRISEAYEDGQLGVIRQNHQDEYELLKQAVNDELDDMFPHIRRDLSERAFLNLDP